MRPRTKRQHAIVFLAIFAISVLAALLLNGLLTFGEKATHPRKYSVYVSKYAEKYAIPESVIYAVIKTESDFDPLAVSHAGAVGLMQILPETYRWLAEYHLKETYDERFLRDPETNIRVGSYLLSFLYKRYGNWETAFAAYNAGLGNVDTWLDTPEYIDENRLLKEIPFKETREYVKKVKHNEEVYTRLYYS